MTVKLIVFDMAGTTVEDKEHVAGTLIKAMNAFGYHHIDVQDVNLVMGYPKPVAICYLLEQYAGDGVAADTELVASIHRRFVDEMIRFYEEDPGIKEKEGATDTFFRLREMGIKVGLDTGFSREIADVIIRRIGWEEGVHFDVSVTSDEVQRGRPHPDMIYRAMELLGIDSADEVAKVGDTVSDLQEGNAAGCKYVIGIVTGAYTEAELTRENHTHLVAKLEEVPGIVSNVAVY